MPRDTLPSYQSLDVASLQSEQVPRDAAQPKSTYLQPPRGYAQQPGTGYEQPDQPPPCNQPTQQKMPAGGQHQFNIIAGEQRPPHYLACSIITCIFCNLLLGIVAVMFSAKSFLQADAGNMVKARKYGTAALCLNLFGILTGVIFGISIAVYISSGQCGKYYTSSIFC